MGHESIYSLPYLGMPFHFWSAVFFFFGCIVGSFLNVVIHRLPLDQSIVSPPSHCPHCNYSIPWYLNIPLVTWVWLRGKCANCGQPVSVRYFLVEFLTGIAFLACWLVYGSISTAMVLILCLFLSGIIAGTFIDFEHYIIPDQITLGGIIAGLACSLFFFFFPNAHVLGHHRINLFESLGGAAFGAGLIYAVLRLGKLLFGRIKKELPKDTLVMFDDAAIRIEGEEIQYEEIFYRRTDAIELVAERVEMADRCYQSVKIDLRSDTLLVGDDKFDPRKVPFMEVITSAISFPREAMGLGDVKFMAAVGAFFGWQAVLFSLMVSCVAGSAVGLTLIALKKGNEAGRLPFVPYMALGTVVWIFGGAKIWHEFYGPLLGQH